MNSYIGVDLGGTKLLIGEMTADGTLLRSSRYPSGLRDQPQALARITECLDDFLTGSTPGYTPIAIGIGLVGRVNSRIWYEIDPGRAEPIDMAEYIRQRYGLPCFLDNDVRSAAKAEMRFGQGGADFLYLNIGTGIAAGFVSGGRLITGGHWNAGEVGHTASGLALHIPCPCGRPDCVERVAAGVGLDASARALHSQYPDTLLPIPETGRVAAEDIFRLESQDPLCALLLENAAQAIANLIMNLIRFNDPETIVLGGGIVANGVLYPRILAKLNPETTRFVTNGIVLTQLDPRYAGVLGAGCNAIIAMEESE